MYSYSYYEMDNKIITLFMALFVLIWILFINCIGPITDFINFSSKYNEKIESNISEYNDSVKDLKELFENSVNSLILVDTSNINMNDLSIKVACEVMNAMRSKYIESFKKKYKL